MEGNASILNEIPDISLIANIRPECFNNSVGRVPIFVKALDIDGYGIGINDQDIPKIFDEFFRSKGAKKIDPYGKGLGLPFVKQLVEGLGGTIRVKSKKGKGSEFTLVFPEA